MGCCVPARTAAAVTHARTLSAEHSNCFWLLLLLLLLSLTSSKQQQQQQQQQFHE